MVVQGKAVFLCPKTGKEVFLHETCIFNEETKLPCPYFHGYGYIGARPYITCDYGTAKRYAHDVGEKEKREVTDKLT